MDKNCIFCTIPKEERIIETSLWLARKDKFPVTNGHTLIIPARHVSNVDDLTAEEWSTLFPLIVKFSGGGDFNVGINRGPLAGQTVFHVHVHVFPRTVGDVPNPRGGIRNFKPSLVPYI
jgi:diadenosine tetraphosphate (Ap4A) HIT family hydrolase